MDELSRHGAVALAAALGSGILVNMAGVLVPAEAAAKARTTKPAEMKKKKTEQDGGGGGEGGEDVSAAEDLMREHGVLRRTLNVYAEVADRLRTNPRQIDPKALVDAAELFREFGEDYHERTLEEQFVFPEVRRTGGPNEPLVETLLIQHQRGREITDFIRQIGTRGQVDSRAQPLARALASMVRMYNAHSTWEDTVVFPAWKKAQSKARLEELAEEFEEIEHQQFGKDGFDDAVARIRRIEKLLGLADLAHYTAPVLDAGL
ncbi:MAG: hemerythrin domain-containing protein [Hyphomicrobiales bacterium]